MAYVLLGVLLALGIGVAYARRVAEPKFLSTNEYWIYLPSEKMPPQDAIMTRLLRENPIAGAVGPREGLLLSDIRLHIALVLRSKNPHVFRPDLFEEHIEPTARILEDLSNCQSLVKVRYVSEVPLKDRASVQLLPYLAEAVADLGAGSVIYDSVKEELHSTDDFRAALQASRDQTGAETQVRTIWRRAEVGGWAETRGLRKVGLQELATEPMEADEQLLVTEVLDGAARELWASTDPVDEVTVALFGDTFQVKLEVPKNRVSKVKILRVQAV